MLLKIKAIIKRNDEQIAYNDSIDFSFGKFFYVPRLRELTINGVTEKLSPKEGNLLRLLLENKNDLLSREEALKKVWGSDSYFNGRSMDVYIAKLRKYLKDDESVEIKNIHGNGFKMIVP